MHSLPALAERLQHIHPFQVMELLGRARALEAQGRDIVHMEVGEPDFVTAEPILQAGMAALRAGQTRYTDAGGLPALREAIAGHYRREHGVTVDPARIFVTPGASGALLLALALLVNPGQQVLLPDPGYPCNRHFVRLLNGEPCSVPVGADTAYQLSPECLDEHWDARTVAAMVGSPGNPTGTVLSGPALAALADGCARRGGILLVDEIYHGLSYTDAPLASAAALDTPTLVVNSFSKYFGMTGWRLGWLLVPEGWERATEKLAQNVFIAASAPAQHAALACFTEEARAVFEQRRQAFRERRDYLAPALRALGFHIPVLPGGAFYLYADASEHTRDSRDFAARLLEQAGVAVTPGCDFGDHQASRHLRFAYTTGLAQLEAGVRGISQFLGEDRG
ncbi:pyridoxal phosphate-dependent aminotransferase [Alkalilimnicola sp. S0819]|uniref:pyridoxal phosphate-dependent aminotransferase n=1 Tax=Alkalilimnicola sp. S0819 TaxID=2613922 RepID=UPI0012626FC6|nr:pyridoxal phosphate-dependent aminotransferase [Alkalilimnicola sp. S0819]KAB7628482.1 pyridoxal phosphate-dependent aminotransferase [Alkalilimnicola sp. S0819]MPQ15359.1 pyridoxal phosphate-dependent aminotransferase [Alkalilimnicola sp. S0819]